MACYVIKRGKGCAFCNKDGKVLYALTLGKLS